MEDRAQPLDAVAIHAEVPASEPRGRAHLDRAAVEEELDVVDEAKQLAAELRMQVIGSGGNDRRARKRFDGLAHRRDRVPSERNRRDVVLGVGGIGLR